jgi:hypothetical protein
MTRSVLLVGSSPFDTVREALETFGSELRGFVKRLPDGEPGPRRQWISWQMRTTIATAKGLEPDHADDPTYGSTMYSYRIKPGLGANDLTFGRLGYADEAKRSYETFKSLRDAGKIAAGTRFQVCLPTPFAVCSRIVPDDLAAVWRLYEDKLFGEIAEICAALPPTDLAIQWDIATEITAVLENQKPELARRFPKDVHVAAIARAADRVPAAAELGLHFCYGDLHHKHLVEPKDTAIMVDFCNRIVPAISRPVTWVHMPVPRSRDDDAYFSPLKALKLPPGTEFYLGLVHMTGGPDGIKRRITAAKRVVSDFGVATECGLGRRSADAMPELMKLHREAAEL